MNNRASTEAPILIGGCGSSGTTLVSHLLNAHPDIFCGPELYLLNKKALYTEPFQYTKSEFLAFLQRRNHIITTGVLGTDLRPSSTCIDMKRSDTTFMRAIDQYGFDDDMICDLASRQTSFKEFVDSFFKAVIARERKSRWAEKTPNNCYCICDYLSLYPSGHYIHVVRDGRDVVASLSKRGSSVESAVRRWLHDTITSLPHRHNPRYFEVKYEDLVTKPEETLATLFRSLGLDDDPAIVLTGAINRSVIELTHESWVLRPDQPISSKSVGKWKREDYANKKIYPAVVPLHNYR